MVLSVFVALILSPALAATLLKRPSAEQKARHGGFRRRIAGYGHRFNDWFGRTSDRYRDATRTIIERRRVPALVIYGVVVAILIGLFVHLPTGFLPTEDQGGAQLQYTLAPGATQTRTVEAAKEIERYFIASPELLPCPASPWISNEGTPLKRLRLAGACPHEVRANDE
jgi:multidrug efflux pump